MNTASTLSTRGASRARLLLVALLVGAMASQSVFAFGGRGRGHGHGHGHGRGAIGFGLFVAAPLIAYSLYRPHYQPTYYYPPVVYSPPPVYLEQAVPQQQFQPAPQAAPQAEQAWWYYCAESQTYYPYARQCPGGWERVAPRPPA